MAETHSGRRRAAATVSLLCLFVLVAMAMYLACSSVDQALHADEALYGYWGLTIAGGRDFWLVETAVDKPPLFLYLLALSMRLWGSSLLALRLPNLLASAVSIPLLYRLGRKLYGRETAFVAALTQTLSPFVILFAPTAFTDPLMVDLVLVSLLLALGGRSVLAGLACGLAAATKQSGLFFLPLVVSFALVAKDSGAFRRRALLKICLGFLAVLGILLVWDLPRQVEHGFLAQGWIHYGGLRETDPFDLFPELARWAELLGYFTGSPVLNLVLVAGIPLLLGRALVHEGGESRLWHHFGATEAGNGRFERQKRYDVLILTFLLLYLEMHLLVSFKPWDRYLLGLMPLLGLIMGRVLHMFASVGRLARASGAKIAVLLFLVAVLMASPALTAAQAGYDIGSDHRAYRGVDQVAEYVRRNVPDEGLIYHRWLGNYISFYLFGAPQTVRWYETPQSLAADVSGAGDGRPRYVVTTAGEDVVVLEEALAERGFGLDLLHRVDDPVGGAAFGVYAISR